MFNQTFVNGTSKTKKPLALLCSFLLEGLAICALILIPLVYTHALPSAQLRSYLVAPPPPVSPAAIRTIKVQAKAPIRQLNTRQLVAPVVIPSKVNVVSDSEPAPDVPVFGGNVDANAAANSVLGVMGAPSGLAAAPPAVPVKPKSHPAPVRIGTLSEANLIRKVQPVYPPLAKSAGIQGTVEFTATIGKEGNIENLQLVRGHPLLVRAARDAVLQWKYRPTLLNGQPVEVITDIVVKFTLLQ